MNTATIEEFIEEYLQKAKLMQVATAFDNQPWACSVYFASDEEFNLYWISFPSTRHSYEIEKNNKVAGTIVLPHNPGEDVRGIQFQGIANKLVNPLEMESAMKYYGERYNLTEKRIKDILQGTDGHVPYRIQPKHIVLYDEVNFPNSPRQEIKL